MFSIWKLGYYQAYTSTIFKPRTTYSFPKTLYGFFLGGKRSASGIFPLQTFLITASSFWILILILKRFWEGRNESRYVPRTMFRKGSYRNFYQDAYVGIIPKRFYQNVIRMFRVELFQKGSVRMLSECSARNVVGRFILTFSAPFQNDSIRFPGTFWGRSGYKYSERCADWVAASFDLTQTWIFLVKTYILRKINVTIEFYAQ